MRDFFEFLMDKKGNIETKLIEETIFCSNDNKNFEMARKVSSIHPSLYCVLCKDALNKNLVDKAEKIVKGVLKYVPTNYSIRSKVVYMLAYKYKKRNNNLKYKEYLIEGFLLNALPFNF